MTGNPSEQSKAIVMLFSGGLDTTLEVAARLEQYQKVYLLTFNNGYCINMNGAAGRVEKLREKYGSKRIVHEVAHTGRLMNSLRDAMAPYKSEFRSPLAFDLVCKMSSLSHLILLAHRNQVAEICDGASIEQTQIFLQDPEFSKHIRPCLDEFGLSYVPPVLFHDSRPKKIERLRQERLASGVPALEKVYITSQLLHQPFCLRGFVTFFFTSPLRHLSLVEKYGLPMDRACLLWDRLWPEARRWLKAEVEKAD